ncbi:MAG: hypothetical protein AAFV78_06655 [Bacteroidota bacterium]
MENKDNNTKWWEKFLFGSSRKPDTENTHEAEATDETPTPPESENPADTTEGERTTPPTQNDSDQSFHHSFFSLDEASTTQQDWKQNATAFDDLALDVLIEHIRDASSIKSKIFEKMGYDDAMSMVDPQNGVEQIKATFKADQFREAALSSYFNSKTETAARKKAQLTDKIKELKQKLDVTEPDSDASLLQDKIRKNEEKLDTCFESHDKNRPTSQRFEDLLHERVDKELAHAESQYDLQKIEHKKMTAQLAKVTTHVETELEKWFQLYDKEEIKTIKKKNWLGQEKEVKVDTSAERTEKWNGFMERVNDTFATLGDMHQEVSESLEEQAESIRERYGKIAMQIRRDLPPVHSSMYLRVIGSFLLFVLFGEVYLIFQMTTETLGIYADGGSNPILGKRFYTIAHLLFCFAYPVALGMAVKYYLTYKKGFDGLENRFVRTLLNICVVLIVSIGILNATGAVNLGEFFASLPNSLLKALALIGISLVFTYTTGFMFIDFFEAYERYIDHWGKSPFGSQPEKGRYDQKLNENVQRYQQTILEATQQWQELKDELKQTQEQLWRLEIDIIQPPKDWNFKGLLEELKQAALYAYIRGYDKGRYKVNEEKELDDIVGLFQKQQFSHDILQTPQNGHLN